MTNQPTALAKLHRHLQLLLEVANERQPDDRVTEDFIYGTQNGIKATISVLIGELPYERETMEHIFRMGKLCGEHLYTATDYFTQNYTQDGK